MKRQQTKQTAVQCLLLVCLELLERNKLLTKQNKHLAKSLHKEIDYSEKLENKIKSYKQRNKK